MRLAESTETHCIRRLSTSQPYRSRHESAPCWLQVNNASGTKSFVVNNTKQKKVKCTNVKISIK